LKLTAQSIKRWSFVHTWTSLICTAFLLLLCITGLPLVFKDEIDDWIYPQSVLERSAETTAPGAIDRSIQAAQAKYPNERIQVFFWHPTNPHVIVVVLAPEMRSATPKAHGVAVDTDTGRIVDEPKPRRGLTFYLLKLHTDLFLNLPGKLFLGAMGLLMLASLVSGAVLYGPFARNTEFGAVRVDRTHAVKWLDLHNALGIVTLIWCLVVAATGAFNTLAAPMFDLWRSQELPAIIADYKGMPPPDRLAPVDPVVELAREKSPGMKIVSVVYPYSKYTTEQHFLVWTKGNTPLTSQLFAPVMIDARTGEFSGVLRLPFYIKALELARPLHFGNYGGTPLKIIWAAFDIVAIVILISGLYLWVRRRIRRPHVSVSNAVA
jgi:uncharacterized iron-regulated membrane protein